MRARKANHEGNQKTKGQRRKECMKGREETTSTKLSLEGTETGQKSPEGR